MNEDRLWDMTDAELEEQYLEAKAELDNPELADNTEPAADDDIDDTASTGSDEFDQDQDDDSTDDDNIDDSTDELEQPNTDSDDDDTSTDDEADEDEDEDSDDDNGDPDGDTKDSDEQTDDETDDAEEEVQPVQRRKVKANGKEYDFADDEIMEMFPKVFAQAMDYTKKTQAISKYRKTIDAIEGAKLGHDDVNLMIDVLKGDKGALNEVIKRAGIEAIDLAEDEHEYVAKDYGRSNKELDIKDVMDRISSDSGFHTTNQILSKDWDDESFARLTDDPALIEALHTDVMTGTYAKLQPVMEKLKLYDNGRKTDLDYYWDAARLADQERAQEEARLAAQEQAKELKERAAAEKAKIDAVKAEDNKRKVVRTESNKRKAAAPTKKSSGTAKKTVNYLDASDEEFEKWAAEVEARS